MEVTEIDLDSNYESTLAPLPIEETPELFVDKIYIPKKGAITLNPIFPYPADSTADICRRTSYLMRQCHGGIGNVSGGGEVSVSWGGKEGPKVEASARGTYDHPNGTSGTVKFSRDTSGEKTVKVSGDYTKPSGRPGRL